jgi:hypothetical protein
MADVIKLRVARKAKQATDAQARAQENRVAFGRSKAERAAEVAQQEQRKRLLDAHRREDT